jgi:hypothetical protein
LQLRLQFKQSVPPEMPDKARWQRHRHPSPSRR